MMSQYGWDVINEQKTKNTPKLFLIKKNQIRAKKKNHFKITRAK
jgi:hypothetical protein